MKETTIKLELLNLPTKDELFYTRALRLGLFSISEISKQTSLPRSSCYVIAERLEEKLLIEKFADGKFRVCSPRGYAEKLRRQSLKAQELISPVEALLDKDHADGFGIQRFTGRAEVINQYQKLFNSNTKELCMLGSLGVFASVLGPAQLALFRRDQLSYQIPLTVITGNPKELPDFGFSSQRNLQTVYRYPKDMFSESCILIWDGYVAILSAAPKIEATTFGGPVHGIFLELWDNFLERSTKI